MPVFGPISRRAVSGALWILASVVVWPGAASADSAVEAARQFRAEHGARILRDFAELVAMPNVAAGDAASRADLRRNADWIAERLRARGASIDILELDRAAPLVVGTLPAAGATRTLGLYVHYDGQPVDESAWSQPPWQLTLYDAPVDAGGRPRPLPKDGEPIDPEWRIYGRSTSDDRAPLFALFAALEALAAADLARTSNLVFLFEGEEEVGSPYLAEYLDRYRDRLGADLWLILDGPMHQSRRPQLVFGVRGVVGIEITVYGAARGLHSGHYGNWAPNPALMLAQLLASMKDDDGNVVVDGYFDSVEPLGEAERAALAAVPPVDDDLRYELGLARTEGEGTLGERLLLPSLNIRGFESGRVGARARNMIPNVAAASLDLRLVKGNDPEKMVRRVEDHIRAQGYHLVRDDPDLETRRRHPRIARVVREGGYPAARTSLAHPLVGPLAAATEAAAGEAPILRPSLGGSLPLYLFNDKLERPVVIVPIANHDNNQHAPDENLRLANLWYGIDLMAAILTME